MRKADGKKKTLEVLGRIAEAQVGKSGLKWPPCVGIIYQPKRPKQK